MLLPCAHHSHTRNVHSELHLYHSIEGGGIETHSYHIILAALSTCGGTTNEKSTLAVAVGAARLHDDII